MSTIAGVYSETTLNDIRVIADRIMFDDRIKQQYIPHLDIFKAIQAVQTAQLTPIFRRETGLEGGTSVVKEYDVEVMWRNVCSQSCEENTHCTLGGDKSSTNKQSYSLSWERVVNFTEDEVDYRDNEFDLKVSIAKQLLMADKTLLECFAEYIVSQLNTFKGTNQLGTSGKGVVSGTDTYIDRAYWDGTLVAYFLRVAAMNQFTSPVFLSGQNLYEQFILAAYNAANANGKGEANMYKDLRFFFDLWNIDSVNDPDLITYMLSLGSVAMATKFYNPTTPERTWDFWRYTMPSRWIPGVTYDVFMNDECSSTNDLIKFNYKVKMKGDLFLNPEGCTADNTGVLTFICGTV